MRPTHDPLGMTWIELPATEALPPRPWAPPPSLPEPLIGPSAPAAGGVLALPVDTWAPGYDEERTAAPVSVPAHTAPCSPELAVYHSVEFL